MNSLSLQLSLNQLSSSQNYPEVYIKKENIKKSIQTVVIVEDLIKLTNPQKTIESIIKIQSLFRGFRVRRSIYLPKLISPFLEGYLLSEIIKVSTLILCREINEMLENPEKYTDRCQTLDLDSKINYLIPSFNQQNVYQNCIQASVKNVALLEMSSNKEISLLLILEKIGYGSSKDVYNGNLVQFRNRKFVVQPNVVIYPFKDKNEKNYKHQIQFREKWILEEIRIHKTLLEKIAPLSVHSTPLLIQRKNLLVSNSESLLSWRNPWINSDLQNALKKHAVPITNKKDSAMRILSYADYISVICDVAKVLKEMHENKYIHRDVKPGNIFIKIDDQNNCIGILGDFGLTNLIGSWEQHVQYYEVWDWSARMGAFTPFTDLYGLTMTLGWIFLPNFDEMIRHCQIKKHSTNPHECTLYEQLNEYKSKLFAELKIMNMAYLKAKNMQGISELISKSPENNTLKILDHIKMSKLVTDADGLNAINYRIYVDKVKLKIFNLVFESIKTSNQLCNFLLINEEVTNAFFNRKANIEAIITKLDEMFPFAVHFYKTLEEIKEMLQGINK